MTICIAVCLTINVPLSLPHSSLPRLASSMATLLLPQPSAMFCPTDISVSFVSPHKLMLLILILLALPLASAFVPARRLLLTDLAMVGGKNSLGLPIIKPERFKKFELETDEQLTRVCQSLRSLKKERICKAPLVEAWYTTDGQSILLGDKLCPDVLFVRSHHGKLFQKIRHNDRVILTGNPGISKSV